MRRLLLALTAAALLTAAATPVVLAGKPANTCAAAASRYFLVDRNVWWDITVDGFVAAGIPVYEEDGVTFTDAFNDFGAAFGLGNGAGVEEFVKFTQWAEIDHNDNGLVCMKRRPITPGNPAYLFNGVDDQASSPSAA